MTAAHGAIDRLADDVARLGRRALPRELYFRELAARLRRVVDCDAMCWHTLDPQTLLITSDAPDELIGSGVYTPETAQWAGGQVVASEYMGGEVNTFAALARRRIPVGILSEATRGRPDRSTRYGSVLAPSGIPFEMRAAFVSRGRAWGAVHLARRDDGRDFARADEDAVAHVAGAIADGIRTSLRFDAARRSDEPSAPGLVVLDAANEVQLITAPARELMAALRSSPAPASDETPPVAVLAAAAFARRASRESLPQPGAVAFPTESGYITLHAALPDGRADGDVAIVLEHAATHQAATLRLEAHGVTEREREVAVMLARGLSNAAIADRLVLSPYTVQDHIRSLFEKTGVRSRQELVARVFLDDYLPQIARRAPLTSRGSLVRGPTQIE
jgi:DNA-binding NarL/FixJ family response regulator